jgi:hypothetical protein
LCTPWSVYQHDHHRIGIGCEIHTLSEWQDADWTNLIDSEHLTSEQVATYRRVVAWVAVEMAERKAITAPESAVPAW